MKTFKNKNFTKRDYECTNVVFCQSETAPNESYKECDYSEISALKCTQLFTQDGVTFFGYL